MVPTKLKKSNGQDHLTGRLPLETMKQPHQWLPMSFRASRTKNQWPFKLPFSHFQPAQPPRLPLLPGRRLYRSPSIIPYRQGSYPPYPTQPSPPRPIMHHIHIPLTPPTLIGTLSPLNLEAEAETSVACAELRVTYLHPIYSDLPSPLSY